MPVNFSAFFHFLIWGFWLWCDQIEPSSLVNLSPQCHSPALFLFLYICSNKRKLGVMKCGIKRGSVQSLDWTSTGCFGAHAAEQISISFISQSSGSFSLWRNDPTRSPSRLKLIWRQKLTLFFYPRTLSLSAAFFTLTLFQMSCFRSARWSCLL